MHVAFFTNTYRPVVSGVVRSVDTFREGLVALGHNVFIFAQRADKYEDTVPFVFRYPSLDLPVTHQFPLIIPVSRFVDRLLPSLKPDVIHSHHPFLLGQAAVDKAKKLNVPMVFTFHTRYREYSHYVSLDQDTVKAVIHHWLSDYMRDCHHIIVPSNSIKQMLADEYGMDEQVTTLPTGINLAPYRAADSQSVREERGWGNDMVLISIGRLAKEKNWDTLIKAVAKVMQTHNDLRLVLIGEGEERKALQELAHDLGVGDKVEFTGIVPYEEVPAHLKAANLFCFASVTETQGLVTMEAMAADLPVVAVEATGTSDVVESGRDGLLTENNANALAQAIARVIDHPDLMAQLREAAIQRAADFDMIRQAERLVAVYEQAAEDQKAGRTVPIPKSTKLIDAIVDGDSWLKVLGFDKDKWARA